MIRRTTLCLVTIGFVLLSCTLAGCGRKDKPPTTQEDYARYFGRNALAPKDRTVRVMALPAQRSYRPGDAVELTLTFANMAKSPRRLPIGRQTDNGFVYTFMSALVRKQDGPIERVTFPDAAGDLVSLDLKGLDTANSPPLFLGDYYSFDEPGSYEVLLFYTVEKGPLPDGTAPGWTGTVWSPLIGIVIE
jgi:hypothetical protein